MGEHIKKYKPIKPIKEKCNQKHKPNKLKQEQKLKERDKWFLQHPDCGNCGSRWCNC